MKPTLLIAEGDAELRDVYQRFLTRRGFEVTAVADGLDCVRQMRRQAPAAVVLDGALRWGGADGVLAWLREEDALAGVGVVLTTTAGCPAEVADDADPPVVGFLPKPFKLAALLESVRAAVANRR